MKPRRTFIEWSERYCEDLAEPDCDFCGGAGGSCFGPCAFCNGCDDGCVFCGGHGRYPCVCVQDRIVGRQHKDPARQTMNRLEDMYRATRQREDDALFRIHYEQEMSSGCALKGE